MNQLWSLAWRNLWRKKRRSLITLASVAFAVFLAITLRSVQWGSYGKMIEGGVRNSGYLQVHTAGYWTDKSVNDLLADSLRLREQLAAVPGVRLVVPRLQNFALAAGPQNSKGTLVLGIDPARETQLNKLATKVVSGRYLSDTTRGVLVAAGLAKFLRLGVGDELVLVGQGHHAATAAAKYRIAGLVQLPNPVLNKQAVYLPLALAQEFNTAEGLASAYLLDLAEPDALPAVQATLTRQLGPRYEVLGWPQMQPEIQQNINTDTTVAFMMLSCLYLVVGFGLLGTVLMMALERRREFGLLLAVGMSRGRIQLLVLLEALLLGGLGVLVAFVLVTPLVYWFHTHPVPLTGEGAESFRAMGAEPVIQLAFKPFIYGIQGGVVLGLMLLAAALPALLIRRLSLSDAIR